MTHKIANEVPPGYRRAAIYFSDSDCVEYVQEDTFLIYERVDGFLTLVRDATGENLVGFKLKGFRNMVEQMKPIVALSDKQFLMLVSVIERVYTQAGDALFSDPKRAEAYKAAYRLAANDNVFLDDAMLLAA